ncbi:MAG: GDSL-type esterase/lipase family protein [Peptococcia bacterium]|jgi:acyl-CoA thioesterase-1
MEDYTVVALGDSLTYGYPFSPQDSWAEVLRLATGWKVINAGISGDTLGDMQRRIQRDVLVHKPELVILMGGSNDVYQGISQLVMEQNFLLIWETLAKNGIAGWLGLPLPVADDYAEGKLSVWRNWLKDFGQQKKITVVDFYRDFVSEEGWIRSDLFVDDCHPTIEGYQVMGKRILTLINDSEK